MESQQWKLVFRRELVDGFEAEAVKQGFARVFKLGEARVEQIFSHDEVILRGSLEREQAEGYRQALERLGMVTHIEPEATAEMTRPATPEPSPDSSSEAEEERLEPTLQPQEERFDEPRQLPFHFSGQGAEYFKIWIVNIVLTILTLGIYSAWAKVRNRRYFYGNTRLEGSSFDYLANPITILKGRLIAFALFVILALVDALAPLFSPIASLLFLLVFPWLVCKSLSFNARNSAYRNVTFAFDGRYVQAFVAFILWSIAGALTVGLLMPMAYQRQQRFIIDNSRYGGTEFSFTAGVGDYYRVIVVGILLFFAALGIAMVLSMVLPPLAGLAILVAYLVAIVYFNVYMVNLKFNNTMLNGHGFNADYEIRSYAPLFLMNSLLVIITLGLYIPWAKVSFARYKSHHISFVAIGPLDRFVATEEKRVSAIGQEVADVFDFDIGI